MTTHRSYRDVTDLWEYTAEDIKRLILNDIFEGGEPDGGSVEVIFNQIPSMTIRVIHKYTEES